MTPDKKKKTIKYTLTAVILSGVLGSIFFAGEKENETVQSSDHHETATFAGGCFWCIQPPFAGLKGVVSTSVGYTDGTLKNPTYQQVCSGTTGHTEAIEIKFDPTIISYQELLDVFWMNIDPTVKNRQFVDVGTQYRAGIYYHNDRQKELAQKSKKNLQDSKRFGKKIVTEIKMATTFYHAEEYHQQYYKKSPVSYYRYRRGSGRDEFLEKHWGKNKNETR